MMSMKYAWSMYDGIEPTSCKKMWARTTVCDGYGDDIYASPGCGYHRTERGCYEWDWQTQGWVVSPNNGYGCRRRVERHDTQRGAAVVATPARASSARVSIDEFVYDTFE